MFELPFLAFGTFWFWLAFIILNLFLLFGIEEEWGFGLLANVCLIFVLVDIVADVGLLALLLANPLLTIPGVCSYIAIGTAWSFTRWYLYLIDRKEDYLKEKKYVLENYKQNKAAYFNENQTQEDALEYFHKRFPFPKVSESKARIIRWIVFWPWNAFWKISNKFVKDFIYEKLASQYGKLASKVFGDISKEWE